MTFADDLVEAQQPFVDASPDGSYEDFLRAQGAMFEQMEGYAAEPDEADGPSFFIYMPNRAINPSFEYDQAGNSPQGYDGTVLLATNLVQGSTWHDTPGVQTLHLVTAALTAAQVALWTLRGPDAGPGVFAGLTGWNASRLATRSLAGRFAYNVNSVSGSHQVSMWLNCYDAAGASVGQIQVPANGAVSTVGVHAVSGLTTLPAGTVWFRPSLAVKCITAGTLDLNVDSIGLFFDPASVIPAYRDGDFVGWDWSDTPGNSLSEPTRPLPAVGWSKLLDIDAADTTGLPYLAQWVGERVPTGMSDSQARQLIRQNPTAYRGTLEAVALGIMPMLTGTQTVFTKERSRMDGTSDVNWLAVLTYASETPNASLVQQQIRNKLLGANILLDYATSFRNTWTQVETGSPTWSAMQAGKTWSQLETNTSAPPGFTVWVPYRAVTVTPVTPVTPPPPVVAAPVNISPPVISGPDAPTNITPPVIS